MVVKYVSSLRSFPNTMDVKVKGELRPLSKLSKGKYIIGHFVVAIALVPRDSSPGTTHMKVCVICMLF